MNTSARGRGTDIALPAPELSHLSLQELREYRAVLTKEEERVSYWRRLVQARIDILGVASTSVEPLTPEKLVKALGETVTGTRRGALLSVNPADDLPDLPNINGIWAQAPDPHDPVAAEEAMSAMREAEQRLSEYRRLVHERLDAATGELITRYRENPTLCFDLTEDAAA